MSDCYILGPDGRTPVQVADTLTWARWLEGDFSKRVVARDVLPDGRLISSVFLGLDHSFGSDRPILFETMLFQSTKNLSEEYGRRSSTWTGALIEHDVALLFGLGVIDGLTMDMINGTVRAQ